MLRGTLVCLALGLCAFWPQTLVLCCAPDGGCGVRPADRGCEDSDPGDCSDCDDLAPGEAPARAPAPPVGPEPVTRAVADAAPVLAGTLPAGPEPPPPPGRLRALDGVLLTI